MTQNSIQRLNEFGQSVWLDYISRSLITSGRLQEMIGQGLRGMTSNPTIFDKAVNSGADYDERISALHKEGKSIFQIYDELTVRDIRDAADIFLPVYEESDGLDGYVSLEINPKLAYETDETIAEGKRLHKRVNRPNVMFKVPATDQGFKAVEELIAAGININITLIFAVEQYVNTAHAYLRGIKRLLQGNADVSKLRSVASVFASRIDTLTDKLIADLLAEEQDQAKREQLMSLKGKAAIANCRLIYKKHLDIFSSAEFKELHEKGANFQRVLWGSTGTKNPAYSDIKYVTELIGRNTVNTMPENTLKAFLEHGEVEEALTADVSGAQGVIDTLKGLGIDINEVCDRLLKDGVAAFAKSFESLLNSIQHKVKTL
jgi:transaldolase